MTPYPRRILLAFAERAIAPSQRVGLRPADVDVVTSVERQIAGAPPFIRWGLGALLIAFDLLPPLHGYGLRRFSTLRPEDQDAYIGAALNSGLYERRLAVRALVILVHSAFYGDVRVSQALGRVLPRP